MHGLSVSRRLAFLFVSVSHYPFDSLPEQWCALNMFALVVLWCANDVLGDRCTDGRVQRPLHVTVSTRTAPSSLLQLSRHAVMQASSPLGLLPAHTQKVFMHPNSASTTHTTLSSPLTPPPPSRCPALSHPPPLSPRSRTPPPLSPPFLLCRQALYASKEH